ncbi:MAG: PA14 domain-containing protein [Chloroflexota bacterium]
MISKRNVSWLALPLVLAGILALWLMPGAPTAAAADATWRARYFNNRDLSGEPAWRRDEDAIDHDWGGGSPNAPLINDDNFSVRWTRSINLPAGTYRFYATMDDGMRVWIDDQLVIDNWTPSQQHTVTADRYLNGGDHAFRVEYFEAGGVAVAKFSWQAIGAGAPAPGNAFRGEYFANRNLSGAAQFTRDDAAINFDWGDGAPAANFPNDNFSVRWTRTLNFNPGTYRFDVFSDDGVRLWVNNQLVVDQWRDQANGRFSADVALSGNTTLRLEYYDATGRAAVSLSWNEVPGTGGPVLPGTWRGEFFNNKNLSGSPVAVRDDAAINFNWGNGSPMAGVNSDQFSVRWTRDYAFPAGTYRFDVFSDDGVRLWVNNQLIIDQWRDQPDGRFSATVNLSGNTPLRLEYYDNTGRAAVALSWTALSGGTPTGGATATVISTLRLNVRNAPSVSGGALLQQLQPGQTVGLTGFKSADSLWVEIFRPGGGTGWVYARWVDTSVPVSSLAVK